MLPSKPLNQGLLLYHEIMLLSICDKTGEFCSAGHTVGAATAMLVELVLRKRITIVDERKKTVSVSTEPTGDTLLDEATRLVASSKCKLNTHSAIAKIATLPDLSGRVIKELCDRKILRKEKRKVMWFFEKSYYPTVDGKAEREIRSRMAKLLFGQTTSHDRASTLLVVLAEQLGLLSKNFDPDRLKRNEERIKKVASGEKFKARASQSAKLAMNDALAAAALLGTVASGA